MHDGATLGPGSGRRATKSERRLVERLAEARRAVLVRRAQLIVAEASGRKVRKRRRQLAEALLEVARAESALLEAGLPVPPEPPMGIALDAAWDREPASLAWQAATVTPETGSRPVTGSTAAALSGEAPPSTGPARAASSAAGPAPSGGAAPGEAGQANGPPATPIGSGTGARTRVPRTRSDSPVRAAARRAVREAAEALTGPATPLSGGAASLAGAPPILGVVDVGANSVHLLVAVVGRHQLEPLDDESVFLGLGEAAARGWLGPDLRSALVEALTGYVETSHRLGAETVLLLGTEPLRRVVDTARVVAAIQETSGSDLHVLSHEEEALLTLIGATKGRPVGHDLLVVDVGGGSTELVFAGPEGRHSASGLRLGSAGLTTLHVAHDPPTPEEVERLRAAAIEGLAEAPDGLPREIIAVGGTASNLVKTIPAAILDRTLTVARLLQVMTDLVVEPAETVAARHLIRPERARILPAGAAIMLAIMARYGIDRVTVSEEGIREGAELVLSVAGTGWRDELARLSRGWSGKRSRAASGL